MDTTSLGFQKPKEEEYYDINIFNKNTQLANDLIEKNSSAIGQKLDKDSSFYADLEVYYGNTKLIDDFQDISKWMIYSATPEIDTANIKIGSQSLKLSEINNFAGVLNVYKNLSSPLDLTKLNNGEISTDDDYLKIVLYIPDVTKVEYIALALGQNVGNFTQNRKVIVIPQTSLVTGWNFIQRKKVQFGTDGTGSWNNLNVCSLEWKSVSNAQNAFVSFQLIQLVKSDPDTLLDRPNPFQKFGVKEFNILNGEWFVGYEFGELCIKELGSEESTSVKSLISQKLFGDCNVNFKVKRLGANGVSWFGLLSSNDTGVYVITYQNSLKLKVVSSNQDIIEKTLDFTNNIGDVLIFNIQRVGNKFKIIAYNLTTGIQAESNLEYQLDKVALCIGRSQGINYWNNLFSASITEISHAHHSDISEVAKRLSVHSYSNPNLLINGDFQVWQRGTMFDYTSINNGAPTYTVDRWITSKFNQIISKIPKGIKIKRTVSSGYCGIIQYIEGNYKELIGKKLTFTVDFNLISGGVPYMFVSAMLNGVDTQFIVKYSLSSGKHSIIATIPEGIQENTLRVGIIGSNLAFEMDIYNAKLELGEIATPLSPRGYGQELALCQRYCPGTDLMGIPYSINTSDIWFFIPLNQRLRTTPTLLGQPSVQANNGVIQSGFVFSNVRITNNGIYLLAQKNSHGLTIGNGLNLYTSTSTFDAEIY